MLRVFIRGYTIGPQSEECAYTRMLGILVAHDKTLAPTIRNGISMELLIVLLQEPELYGGTVL